MIKKIPYTTKIQLIFIPTSTKYSGHDVNLFQVFTHKGIPEIGIPPMTYGGYVENPNQFNNSWLDIESYVLGKSIISNGVFIEKSTILNSEINGSITVINSHINNYTKITGFANVINSVISRTTIIGTTVNDDGDTRYSALTEIHNSKLIGPNSINGLSVIKNSFLQANENTFYRNVKIESCDLLTYMTSFNKTALSFIRLSSSHGYFDQFNLHRYSTFGKETKKMELWLRYRSNMNDKSLLTFETPKLIYSPGESRIYFFKDSVTNEINYQIDDIEDGNLDQYYKRYIKKNVNKLYNRDKMKSYYYRALCEFGIKQPNWFYKTIKKIYTFFKSKQDEYTF